MSSRISAPSALKFRDARSIVSSVNEPDLCSATDGKILDIMVDNAADVRAHYAMLRKSRKEPSRL
jgi:hypothetical protein